MFSSSIHENNKNASKTVNSASAYVKNENQYSVDENLNRHKQDNDSNSLVDFHPSKEKMTRHRKMVTTNSRLKNPSNSNNNNNNEEEKSPEFYCDGVVPELRLCPDTPPSGSSYEGNVSFSPQTSSGATMGRKSCVLSSSSKIEPVVVSHSHSSSNSTEENFECFGEGAESIYESNSSEHPSLQYSR